MMTLSSTQIPIDRIYMVANITVRDFICRYALSFALIPRPIPELKS